MVSSLRSGALPLRLDDGPSVGKQTNSKRMREKDDKVPKPGNDKRQELSKVPEVQEEEDEEPFEDNHRKVSLSPATSLIPASAQSKFPVMG